MLLSWIFSSIIAKKAFLTRFGNILSLIIPSLSMFQVPSLFALYKRFEKRSELLGLIGYRDKATFLAMAVIPKNSCEKSNSFVDMNVASKAFIRTVG